MHTSRRQLLKASAVGVAAGLVGSCVAPGKARRKLRLLILGGTGFLGPHTVRAALARGHEMTLFNRGRTNTHLFPELEKLRGDRDGDLKALEGRSWDAVIDTSGYVPRIAGLSAELLAEAVEQYVFISTLSVYAQEDLVGQDETAEVGKLEDETVEQITGTTYGPLKALCEQAVERALPGRTTVIRPGLIVGPGDTSDRFSYWPVRIAGGGEVLAPGKPEYKTEIIDVRDLAEWIIHVIEQRHVGVYNAIGPAEHMTMGQMLEGCKEGLESDASFTWVDEAFLFENGVRAWAHMPAWIPPKMGDQDYSGYGTTSRKRAIAAGLTFRPVADTARATVKWHEERCEKWLEDHEEPYKLRSGITRERESELLAAWSESKQGD